MKYKSFGDCIKALRTERKITMEQLGEQVGITKGAIAHWENSEVIPNAEILKKLSSIFNVSIDYLLGTEVNSENPSIQIIHRGLDNLDEAEVKRALKILEVSFDKFSGGDQDDF